MLERRVKRRSCRVGNRRFGRGRKAVFLPDSGDTQLFRASHTRFSQVKTEIEHHSRADALFPTKNRRGTLAFVLLGAKRSCSARDCTSSRPGTRGPRTWWAARGSRPLSFATAASEETSRSTWTAFWQALFSAQKHGETESD